MDIKIITADSQKEIKQFVDFPYTLYKNTKNWVPPIKSDELKSLMAQHNPAYEFCEVQLWLAMDGSKVVGRIAGIINRRFIEKTGVNIARFSRLEFIDSREVAEKLLQTAEEWARAHEMIGIDGPLGFTNLDHQAMLIEGFEHLPSIGSEYHQPYYRAHLEALGYTKEMDWVEFRITMTDSVLEKSERVAQSVMERYNLKVMNFTKTAELRPYGRQLFEVMDQAFGDLFSYVPFTDRLIDFYVDKYIPILDPKFVKIVVDPQGMMVAFIVGLPSLSEAFQKAKGKLFPFGFLHLLKAYRHPQVMDLLLTGIHPKAQGMGYVALLMAELQRTSIENGIKFTETTGIIEENQKAIQMWKNFEHIQHKRKRCFIKMF